MKTINEKIRWIELNERLPLRHQVADKIEVRKYLKQKGLEEYLNTIYWIGQDLNEVNWNILPEQFIIKATFGCNMNLLVWNKDNFNLQDYQSLFIQWLKVDDTKFEWAYQGLQKRIIIEKLLLENNKVPYDYRIWVMNGKVRMIQIDINKIAFYYTKDFNVNNYGETTRVFYDINWNKLDVTQKLPMYQKELKKPKYFNNMINIAENIGNDFTFIRVDIYHVNNNIIISELTNYPTGGQTNFNPIEFNYELGKYLCL